MWLSDARLCGRGETCRALCPQSLWRSRQRSPFAHSATVATRRSPQQSPTQTEKVEWHEELGRASLLVPRAIAIGCVQLFEQFRPEAGIFTADTSCTLACWRLHHAVLDDCHLALRTDSQVDAALTAYSNTKYRWTSSITTETRHWQL